MRKIIFIIFFSLILLHPVVADENKTQVIIIGCIHEKHAKSKLYTTEILRDIILKLRPEAILIEISKSERYFDKNGNFNEWLRKYIKRGNNELSVANEISEESNIPLIPFDSKGVKQWNYKHSNENLEKEYFKRFERLIGKSKSYINSVIKTFYYVNKLKQSYSLKEPKIINSEVYDNIVMLDKKFQYEILNEIALENELFKDLHNFIKLNRNHYILRNDSMVKNIIDISKKFEGKRIVILVGAEHRFYLKDKLSKVNSIELKEYWQTEEFSYSN